MTKQIESHEKEITEILSKLQPEQKKLLERLRQIIKTQAPEAIEVITYGTPGFKYKGKSFVSYGAAKQHCAFYVQSPKVMEGFEKELASMDTSKGTIRFSPSEPLPEGLIQRIIRARMKEVENV